MSLSSRGIRGQALLLFFFVIRGLKVGIIELAMISYGLLRGLIFHSTFFEAIRSLLKFSKVF